MPGSSQKRFHATIKGPAADALDLVSAHAADILAAWSAGLNSLGIDAAELVPAGFDLASLAEGLRRSTFGSFRRRVKELGQHLASRGARIDHVITALNRLLETCLPYLASAAPNRATPVLALVRLHALATLLLVTGYSGNSITGKKTLVEQSLTEAEHRVRGASAYVTRIYERERRRLSRDLHDEVGHDLILIKLYLEMISMSLQSHPAPEIEPRLTEAITLVSHTIDSVRRLVLDLGPAVFEELGFLPAVKSYANQFSSRTRINVTVQEGYVPENVPSAIQVALYRLMQGALSNVLKHAEAKNVKISLGSLKDSVLIMVIEDDGVGFDTRAKPGRRSFGLTAMRERVEVLGGKFQVESRRSGPAAKKHGTRIEVDLPLAGTEER
jgi:signal transduction histidine kinase